MNILSLTIQDLHGDTTEYPHIAAAKAAAGEESASVITACYKTHGGKVVAQSRPRTINGNPNGAVESVVSEAREELTRLARRSPVM